MHIDIMPGNKKDGHKKVKDIHFGAIKNSSQHRVCQRITNASGHNSISQHRLNNCSHLIWSTELTRNESKRNAPTYVHSADEHRHHLQPFWYMQSTLESHGGLETKIFLTTAYIWCDQLIQQNSRETNQQKCIDLCSQRRRAQASFTTILIHVIYIRIPWGLRDQRNISIQSKLKQHLIELEYCLNQALCVLLIHGNISGK